jgi:hypothetical protein
MKKLDLDKMDEDEKDHSHRDSYDDSERNTMDDESEDEDMLVPGSSSRGQRMSGVEETMFEMR